MYRNFGVGRSYDYGARWYDASIAKFTSVDPLASDYSFQSPYAYAINNPILHRDIMGMGVDTEVFNKKGKKVGEDVNGNDGNVVIVTNKVGKKLKKGKISFDEASDNGYHTTKTTLREVTNVLDRTIENGGFNEEGAIVSENGNVTEVTSGSTEGIEFPAVNGTNNTSIHSHPLNYTLNDDGSISSSSIGPGPGDVASESYSRNIIVGRLGGATNQQTTDHRTGRITNNVSQPGFGAAFYDRNFGGPNKKPELTLGIDAIRSIKNN